MADPAAKAARAAPAAARLKSWPWDASWSKRPPSTPGVAMPRQDRSAKRASAATSARSRSTAARPANRVRWAASSPIPAATAATGRTASPAAAAAMRDRGVKAAAAPAARSNSSAPLFPATMRSSTPKVGKVAWKKANWAVSFWAPTSTTSSSRRSASSTWTDHLAGSPFPSSSRACSPTRKRSAAVASPIRTCPTEASPPISPAWKAVQPHTGCSTPTLKPCSTKRCLTRCPRTRSWRSSASMAASPGWSTASPTTTWCWWST